VYREGTPTTSSIRAASPTALRASVRVGREHVFVRSVAPQVLEMLAKGMSVSAVAVELGVAPNTVRYHRDRSREPSRSAGGPTSRVDGSVANDTSTSDSRSLLPEGRRQVDTRAAVAALLGAGVTRAETARRLGVSKPTVSYHARRLGEMVDERCARRYDWAAVQRFYDEGHPVERCVARFGFSRQTWHAAVNRGDVIPRSARMTLEDLCAEGVPRSRGHLKRRLLEAGLKAPRCERCGIDRWLDQPLGLALHHVNGDRLNNRLENLQLLCPNCHSQTENWGGRNKGRAVTSRGAGRSPGMTEHPEPDEVEMTDAPTGEGGADEPDANREVTPPTTLRTRG